ncbi:hypothetical protein V8E51_002506 [Hyaloscypha variabilis]
MKLQALLITVFLGLTTAMHLAPRGCWCEPGCPQGSNCLSTCPLGRVSANADCFFTCVMSGIVPLSGLAYTSTTMESTSCWQRDEIWGWRGWLEENELLGWKILGTRV